MINANVGHESQGVANKDEYDSCAPVNDVSIAAPRRAIKGLIDEEYAERGETVGMSAGLLFQMIFCQVSDLLL